MSKENHLKLYSVTYNTWNTSFSSLKSNNILAVGAGAEDAIRRTKEIVAQDARDFEAAEITNVMGFKILAADDEILNALHPQEATPGQAETPRSMLLTLTVSEQSYPLVLLASEEQLDHAKRTLGIEEFAQARITSLFSARMLPP